MASLKTYVLLSHTHATAPVYQRVNADQRVRLEKRPIDHAYLRLTFHDNKTGRNRTIRLKLGSDSIYQDEQIKEGILANEPFTNAERDAVKFVNGVLMTKNPKVQAYLDASPQCEGFDGICDQIKGPLYTVFDKTIEVKNKNSEFRKRLAAANKIAGLELKEGQDLMIRLNGNFFVPPNDPDEVQNRLIDFLDQADEDGLDLILKDETNADEEITILISRAIAKGIISFNAIPNQVAKKISGNWVSVKNIPNEYPAPERERHFKEFVLSDAGKLLLEDLKREVNKAGTYEIKNKNDGETVMAMNNEVVESPEPEKKKMGRPKKLSNA